MFYMYSHVSAQVLYFRIVDFQRTTYYVTYGLPVLGSDNDTCHRVVQVSTASSEIWQINDVFRTPLIIQQSVCRSV